MAILDYYGWSPYWSTGFYMGGYGYPAGMTTPIGLGFTSRDREDDVEARTGGDRDLRSVREVTGYHIHARDGEIGHVEDFLLEDGDWSLHYLVVDTQNWWPGKRVLISPRSVRSMGWAERRVNLDIDRQTILDSPDYAGSTAIDRADEYQVSRLSRRPPGHGTGVTPAGLPIIVRHTASPTMPPSYQTRSPTALFEPVQVGAWRLSNRIVMAPLTRNRAGAGLVPGPFAADYYSQRASAGLIIAEATQVSAQAQGYSGTPGCYTDAQVAGWRKVTDAVHAEGGKIVVQLWHTGRVSHTSFQKDGQAPVGPSAIRANTKTFIAGEGFVDCSMPRALELDEISGIIADFRHASVRALEAGFDGVELHGAHGYLLDAFLRDGSNHRSDVYGGSIENRARLLIEVAPSLCDGHRCGPPRRPDIAGLHGRRLPRPRSSGAL